MTFVLSVVEDLMTFVLSVVGDVPVDSETSMVTSSILRIRRPVLEDAPRVGFVCVVSISDVLCN
jgi:hypothetical protein